MPMMIRIGPVMSVEHRRHRSGLKDCVTKKQSSHRELKASHERGGSPSHLDPARQCCCTVLTAVLTSSSLVSHTDSHASSAPVVVRGMTAGALLRELRAAERDAARDAAELAAADLGGFFGMASVKRKRKKAMNKHKHRKRRRRDRHQNK